MEHDHGSGSPAGGDAAAAGHGPGLVVAVDGPGGSGKSTVAKAVARRLGLRYLDTGAMYRAVTQLALEQRVDLEDTEAVAQLAERATITPGTDPDGPTIAVNQVRVDAEIRTRAVTNAVSAVSAVEAVRRRLVAQQRQIVADAVGTTGGIVVEGRDIGTVVATDAPVKVYLTASTEVRALRRSRELGEKGVDDVARTLAELGRRDALDSTRTVDPLLVAPDALVLDSTGMSIDEVVGLVLRRCGEAGFVVPTVAGTPGAAS
ncbi:MULTISPECIES: (d)CMP kinase [unclassified Pseudofrankia]|uniref:(d)CMP kinase n=1 Tax=unclassified Pseudofrankia TaxID=2994372 RepID=UPI0008D93AC2|nr:MULTISPECIES: (d)CMP kinase [unclassified Pseudofrankia]MDT3441845.1 (d)CMP kinase [Pseudofrankia sp. BMG5.37]OHV45681.1 cytidylate kinase [Pseudofrankia sp. BMG5.36]